MQNCKKFLGYLIKKLLYFRRIIDLHMRAEESVERVYEAADISRYISFARLFKPKVTEESMDFLVEQYRHLRQRDTGGGFKSSWRITVRQLESMIRLSEAMARMGCSDQVLPKHVKEAYRLLNKSIIRVDQPDIHFEDEEAIAGNYEFQSVSYSLVTYLGKNNGFLKLNVHSKKLLLFFKVSHIHFL